MGKEFSSPQNTKYSYFFWWDEFSKWQGSGARCQHSITPDCPPNWSSLAFHNRCLRHSTCYCSFALQKAWMLLFKTRLCTLKGRYPNATYISPFGLLTQRRPTLLNPFGSGWKHAEVETTKKLQGFRSRTLKIHWTLKDKLKRGHSTILKDFFFFFNYLVIKSCEWEGS